MSQNEAKIALQVARYEDLTSTELNGIVQHFRLSRSNQFHEAARALQVALDLEHFISTVNINPGNLTPEEIAEIKELRDQNTQITGVFIRLNCLGETGGGQVAELVQSFANLQKG